MKNFPQSMKKAPSVWQSYRINATEKNSPELIYGSMWNTKEVPTMATLQVKISDYDNEQFNCRVTVAIAPQVNTEGIFGLQEFVMKEPKRVFLIHKNVGGNPLDITTIELGDSKKFSNNEIMTEYYEHISKILNAYKYFQEQYLK